MSALYATDSIHSGTMPRHKDFKYMDASTLNTIDSVHSGTMPRHKDFKYMDARVILCAVQDHTVIIAITHTMTLKPTLKSYLLSLSFLAL